MNKREKAYAVCCVVFFTLLTMLGSAHNYIVQRPCTDSTYFLYIGKAIKDGAVMYKDVFDSKGPFLFFLNYLSMMIHETYGIVFIRFLFLLLFYGFSYKTLYLFTQKIYQIWIVLWVATLMLAATLQGGDMSEEFALPLIMGGFYFFLQYAKEGTLSEYKILLSGMFCGLAFLLRANLISVWLVYCAGIMIWLLWQKKIRLLIKYCLLFLAGAILVHLPFLVYFLINGALFDAVYGSFLFNMAYSAESTLTLAELLKWNLKFFFRYHFEIWFLLFAYATYRVWRSEKSNRRIRYFSLVYWVCFFVTLWFVNYSRFTYEHYFMGIIPILVLPLLAALELIEKLVRKRLSFAASAVCIVLVMLLINYPGSVYLKDNVMKYTFDATERNVYQEVGDYIRRNTEEGDVIYSHRMWGILYLTSGRDSATKYFAMTAANTDNFPDMEETLFRDLDEKKPPYIIIQDGRMFGEQLENHLLEYLAEEYHLEKSFENAAGNIHVYRINAG